MPVGGRSWICGYRSEIKLRFETTVRHQFLHSALHLLGFLQDDRSHHFRAVVARADIEPPAPCRDSDGENRNNRDDEQYRPKRDALLMMNSP